MTKRCSVPRELERRFLLRYSPEGYILMPSHIITQGYVLVSDYGNLRLRIKDGKKFQTVKMGNHGDSKEVELPVSDEHFDSLWPLTRDKRLRKIRFEVPCGRHTAELDAFISKGLYGHMQVEVEFKSRAAHDVFVKPDWFGREVTKDERYSNAHLAKHGLPKSAASVFKKKNIKMQRFHDKKEGLSYLCLYCGSIPPHRRAIIAVAGGSASGKTSIVAKGLKEYLGDRATVISMDDYYRGSKYMKRMAKRGVVMNYDEPGAFDIPLLVKHLRMLKNGQPTMKPKYDFKTGEPAGTERVLPNEIVIIEGIFALSKKIARLADLSVFVNIGAHGRLIRRLLRDSERTGQKPVAILRQFVEDVEPMHKKYVQIAIEEADVVIENEYDPKEEALRAKAKERQVKFAKKMSPDKVEALGIFKGSGIEVDTYYDARDRNFLDTGEVLRVRAYGGELWLSYKGPKEDGEVRVRPRFDFSITQELFEALRTIYDPVKVIKKHRARYELNDGVTICLDEVLREMPDKKDLGRFVEFWLPREGYSPVELMQKLGLHPDDIVKEAYFEM